MMKKLIYSVLFLTAFSAFAQEMPQKNQVEKAGSEITEEENYDEDYYDDIMEGEGLTLEAAADPAKEAVSGISVVLNKEQMKTTAQIGLVEDAMSSVQTLPGVTFNGNWNSEPSIRGGYPREMSTVMDGVYLIYPWHWGGAYSIFNPHMIDSVKMSNGVFSARYGRAVSGLMEVTTVNPEDEFHFDVNLTSIATDAFAQIPLGKKAGLFLGGKITYIDGYLGAFRLMAPDSELTDMIKRAPYIRDFYAKAYFNPNPDLSINLSGFFGSDGIQISMEEKKEIGSIPYRKETSDFDYDIYQGFINLNAKWLATEKLQFKGAVTYNILREDMEADSDVQGFFEYSPLFTAQYGNLLDDDARKRGYYKLDSQPIHGEEKITEHMIQGRLESEIQLGENHTLGFGAEEVWTRSDSTNIFEGWMELKRGENKIPDFVWGSGKINADGNNTFNTAGYALWSFGGETTLLRGELGLRTEHLAIINTNDDFSIIGKPMFNPRASLQFTPWRNTNHFDKVTFSVGSGLFTSIPMETVLIEKEMDLDSDDIKPNQVLMGVLGTDIHFNDMYSFKLEGYYKYYLSRLFIVEDNRNPAKIEYDACTDGKGHVAGFDFMLEKKNGNFFDGYISYSFVYARFKNPYTKHYDDQLTNRDDPLDEWYYPGFHRYHTLNAVANFKFNRHWTFTVKGTFATGNPRFEEGQIYCYPAKAPDGTIIQRYSRDYKYSDSCRTDISCPIDIRLGYKTELGKTGTIEWYIGAEDIFQNIYSPKGYKKFDQRTGKETNHTENANFSIGIPMVSTGVKVSF